MSLIVELLYSALTRLATIIGIATGIQTLINALSGQVSNTALQTTLVDTEDDVVLVLTNVQDPSYGLSALSVQIAEAQTVLLAAITATQQSGSPVTLPTTPPPGYGGGSSSLTADEVWEYVVPGQEFTTGGLNAFSGNYARSVGNYILAPLMTTNYFSIAGDLWDVEGDYFQGGWPIGDPTTILPTDTVLTWLERESNLTGWFLQSNGTLYAWQIPDFENPLYFVCNLDAASFAALQASGTAHPVLVPPVWPGYDKVTIGAPVTLEGGVALTTPCDGVLVEIFTVPAKQGYFTFDSAISWRNVGAIAFYEASGRVELPQLLGFENAIYCPKTMTTSAGCHIRALAGVTGFVYPWSITA